LLSDLVARWCALPVRSVSAGERITPGAVSIARFDLHLGRPTLYWKEPA
jgi:chemotaxis response regulator CheB